MEDGSSINSNLHEEENHQNLFSNETIKEASASPQLSTSLECKYSENNSSKSAAPGLFSWNQEQPRYNEEYVDKNFSKPFNNFAEEVNIIGGLGPIKCINKKKHLKFVNRPTQVEKFSHTTTKVLPNFNLTEQLKPIVCERKKHMSIREHVEKVRVTENLPISDEASVLDGNSTMKSFNHENPFNLDLNALSEYQKQKSYAEDIQRRRNYQIIRRTMETKKLKTVGAERIKQEERDAKFKLPAFFKISHQDGEHEDTTAQLPVSPTTPRSSSKYKCKVVAMLDKPKNKEIVELHYQHKEDKLRERIRKQKVRDDAMAIENEKREQEMKENEIFRLADESFPSSKCSSVAADKEHDEKEQNDMTKFDYEANEMESFCRMGKMKCQELVENDNRNQADLACGHRVGSHVILRGFHDRKFSEPRGKSNLHAIQNVTNETCRTHKDWIKTITNDPKIVNPPPKGKILSSKKGACDPNDEKMFMFNDEFVSKTTTTTTMMRNKPANSKKIVMKNIDSPIKRHIKEIDKKLKQKYLSRTRKSLKSQMDMSEAQKRHQRMNFMGIPTTTTAGIFQLEKSNEIKGVHENDDKLSSKDTHLPPEAVKLIPKIPSLCCDIGEDEQSKVMPQVSFSKANPRGNDAKMLRIDKSLPWIEDEINSARLKFHSDNDKMRRDSRNVAIDNWNHVSIDSNVMRKKKAVEDDGATDDDKNKNQSELKKNFNNLIATKLKDCKTTAGIEHQDDDNNIAHASDDDYEMKSAQSTSTLSSTGTYFSNDSGSYAMLLGEKIPKSHVNIGNKFQNHSKVTTKIEESLESTPYFICDLGTMKKLRKPPDRFYTQRTRSCANIRERVKVNSLDYEDELIGSKSFKMKSLLATDIDEFYTKELYHERTRTEFRFKRISETEKIRHGFRKKIEAYYIKEKLMLDEIHAKKEAKILSEVTEAVNEYETFLKDWKEISYRNSMRVMQDVKKYYHTTDTIRSEHDALKAQLEPIKLRIYYLGNDFMRLRQYQHFQYLIMPTEWRIKHDHLHLNTVDGKLEDISLSIKHRTTKGVWNRQNGTIDAIVNYINDIYCKDEHELLIPFRNAKELLDGLQIVESKSFKTLCKYTYAAMIYHTVEHKIIELESVNETYLGHYEFITGLLKKRWKFLRHRSNDFVRKAKVVLDKPLEESFQNESLHQLIAYCQLLFKTKISGKSLDANDSDDSGKYFTHVEKFQMIERKVLNMIAVIDQIPKRIVDEMEFKVRREHKRKLHLAEKAYREEMNIETNKIQLERLFAKPAQRRMKSGKLKRLKLAKTPPKIIPTPSLIDSLEEEYLKAFLEVSDEKEMEKARFDPNVKSMIDKIKDEATPFYVDRFIESLGINMRKLNAQDFEEIIKDEETRLRIKDVLPAVRMKVKYMDFEMNAQKESDIKKTYFLYQRK